MYSNSSRASFIINITSLCGTIQMHLLGGVSYQYGFGTVSDIVYTNIILANYLYMTVRNKKSQLMDARALFSTA